MPAASIIDDLGEEEVEVKMSSAAPQSSEYNCNLHSIVPPTKLKKKKLTVDIVCQIVFVQLFF